MRNLTTRFGENAGKIWHTLYQTGKTDKDHLQESTNLSKKEFYAGIGWLAREDKIRKVSDYYQLDSTNLTDKIGSIAGRVFKILDIWDEADIVTLKKLTDSGEEEVYAALGWLAKEEKIEHQDGKFTLKIEE